MRKRNSECTGKLSGSETTRYYRIIIEHKKNMHQFIEIVLQMKSCIHIMIRLKREVDLL